MIEISGKKILVTGGDGFIGSHLVEQLVDAGAIVTALSQYNSFNNWGWLEHTACLEKINIVSGDIRDPHFCRVITKDQDIIFHLAALIAIPYSYIAPQSYVETNITGTLNICQAALENGCDRIIHTSTSEVYGSAQYVPIDEKHPLQPQSPYSASKIGADAIAMSYYNSFGLPLTIVRPFNTYGPRQSARAVIPTIITQIASGRKQIDLGDTSPTRDFTYVSDTCNGFTRIAQSLNTIGKTINLGSNFEISVHDVFHLVAKLMQADVELFTDPVRIRPVRSEVVRLWSNNSLVKSLTGFEPVVSFEEGLQQTIDWFLQPHQLTRYKPGIYNV
ncbi:NAD-dependent 4,6-dehydratase LegB [Flavihumibacter solisilvae]|uniref:NAD-dependent dehydratase n=1 Tax=Flavihumibacter solisilvae TaxID=1349421 RepID=A0A0C1L1V6_9BACT|nr:NAD-dependent 4,6-dehydratase LegB [Flavihumibacter solisilvae]KIC93571.1 NAD-dependent dehydratase [Flavihumibacter solisilvae]